MNIFFSKGEKKPWLVFVKWVAPMFLAAFGWYIQSIGLHYATYSYVHHMKELLPTQRTKPEYATLPDPVAEYLGAQENIKLQILDMIAVAFPCAFVVLAFAKAKYTLQVWTKVNICVFFLFCLKGLIGAVTTVPDSSGWEVCKVRLKKPGMDYMTQDHTFLDMVFLDFWWVPTHFGLLRYCSDMMYSGHTFVVTLFALGCYEVLRININIHHVARERENMPKGPALPDESLATANKECQTEPINANTKMDSCLTLLSTTVANCWSKLKSKTGCHEVPRACRLGWHIAALALLSLIAMGEQAVEMYCVLRSRFHYTSDVLMALVMVFLMYTNVAISVFAKQWEILGPLSMVPRSLHTKIVPKLPKGLLPLEVEAKDELQENYVYVSRGDAYVPWCCIPFCFGGGGRMHIYSDAGVHQLYTRLTCEKHRAKLWRDKYLELKAQTSGRSSSFKDPMYDEKELQKIQDQVDKDPTYLDLKLEMNLDEGINLQDVKEVFIKDNRCWKQVSKCLKLDDDDSTASASTRVEFAASCQNARYSIYRNPSTHGPSTKSSLSLGSR